MTDKQPRSSSPYEPEIIHDVRAPVTTANSTVAAINGLFFNSPDLSLSNQFIERTNPTAATPGFMGRYGGGALSLLGGLFNAEEAWSADDGFAANGFDMSGDRYAQAAQAGAGIWSGAATLFGASNPYAAAAAAGIGLGRRGQGQMEEWGLDEFSAGGIWDNAMGADGDGILSEDSWMGSMASGGWDAGHDAFGDNWAGDIAGGVLGTVGAGLGSLGPGAALIGGAANNVLAGAYGMASDLGGAAMSIGGAAVSLLTSW